MASKTKQHRGPEFKDKTLLPSNKERLRLKRWKQNIITSIIGLFDLLLLNSAIFLGYHLRFHMEIGVQSGWI